MVFYLLSSDLDVLDVIDSHKSYIWTNKFYEPGDFELCLPATQHWIDCITRDCIIVREGQESNGMIVYNMELQTDIEEGDTLIVKGFCLKSLMDRRIIWNQTNLSGKVEVGIRKLVTENVINPVMPERKIPLLELGELRGFTETLSAQYTGTNLGEAITGLCKSYSYGYDIELDLENKRLIFVLKKGTDRSYNQTENPHVVFSEDYDNILSSNYQLNTYKYKNVAKVAGEGEGLARKYITIGAASGLQRVETYVDARDLSTNEGEISEAEYDNLLIERGLEKISEFSVEESVEGEIEKDYNFIYGEHYFLGDTVEVINKYGIAMTPVIAGVTESEDAGSYDTIIKFES